MKESSLISALFSSFSEKLLMFLPEIIENIGEKITQKMQRFAINFTAFSTDEPFERFEYMNSHRKVKKPIDMIDLTY
jgi:hypothetical protein